MDDIDEKCQGVFRPCSLHVIVVIEGKSEVRRNEKIWSMCNEHASREALAPSLDWLVQ